MAAAAGFFCNAGNHLHSAKIQKITILIIISFHGIFKVVISVFIRWGYIAMSGNDVRITVFMYKQVFRIRID
jgi:hypothetical protein